MKIVFSVIFSIICQLVWLEIKEYRGVLLLVYCNCFILIWSVQSDWMWQLFIGI